MSAVNFLVLAQNELDDIFEALEFQKESQGYRFIAEVERILRLIRAYPTPWHHASTHTQRCFLKGFPYAILYQNIDETIRVIAIMNLYKKPIHWASKSVSEYATCRIATLPEAIYTR